MIGTSHANFRPPRIALKIGYIIESVLIYIPDICSNYSIAMTYSIDDVVRWSSAIVKKCTICVCTAGCFAHQKDFGALVTIEVAQRNNWVTQDSTGINIPDDQESLQRINPGFVREYALDPIGMCRHGERQKGQNPDKD